MQYRATAVVGVSASKFTPECRGGLIERTGAGVSLADACRAEGLRLNTVKSWLQRGRRESKGPYAEFAQAIEEARQAAKDRPSPMDGDELARGTKRLGPGREAALGDAQV